MDQNRFKSPVLWTSVVSQVLALLVLCGFIDTGASGVIEGIAVAVLELLVFLGILNNPTDKANM